MTPLSLFPSSFLKESGYFREAKPLHARIEEADGLFSRPSCVQPYRILFFKEDTRFTVPSGRIRSHRTSPYKAKKLL